MNNKDFKSNDFRDSSLIVPGRIAVSEFLSAGRPVEKIYIQSGEKEGSIKKIISDAKEKKIPVSFVDKEQLFSMSGEKNHQGVVLVGAAKEYVLLDDLFKIAEERNEKPFFAICDGIEDPHNLGAVIRSCDAAGVHGVIIPKNGAVGVTAAVMKTSAGAAEHMAVCKVSNLADAVEKLKKRGVWIYCAEYGGERYDKVDFSGSTAIIFGSEGKGVSRLLKEKSDYIVSLPMMGHVNSLNVSCAATVILYEALKSKTKERN